MITIEKKTEILDSFNFILDDRLRYEVAILSVNHIIDDIPHLASEKYRRLYWESVRKHLEDDAIYHNDLRPGVQDPGSAASSKN